MKNKLSKRNEKPAFWVAAVMCWLSSVVDKLLCRNTEIGMPKYVNPPPPPNRNIVEETNKLFKKNNIWVKVYIEDIKYNLFIDLSNGNLYTPDKTNRFKVSKVNIWEEDGNEHMKFDNLEVLKV
jgi:hypothetical protein